MNVRGRLLDLHTPRVMGILNVTPDSFFDGGRFTGKKSVLDQAGKMLGEGASLIDIGGYSSRPGASHISEDEELGRVVPAVEAVVREFPEAVVCVDTFRSTVARKSVESGASMINDISGGEQDPRMFETVASLSVPYILMHMQGTPQTMATLTAYDVLVRDIVTYLERKIRLLEQLGVQDIIVDPGFGFAKTPEQSYELLGCLDYFRILGKPILAGLSRKSMIWKKIGANPEQALNGTTALNTIALLNGADILRVHDVKEAMECITLLREYQARK